MKRTAGGRMNEDSHVLSWCLSHMTHLIDSNTIGGFSKLVVLWRGDTKTTDRIWLVEPPMTCWRVEDGDRKKNLPLCLKPFLCGT